jgi:predicted Zn-dependent protease
MESFFERLQKYGRLYENGAPGYLRTHPLTTERIADMDNRIQLRPRHQAADSLGFLFIRAKLRAYEGSAHDAIIDFETLVKEQRAASEAAARYGLARAYLRGKNVVGAERQLAELRRLKVESPMLETLAAELRASHNDTAGAAKILQAGFIRYPQDRAISYGLVEALLADGKPEEALRVASDDVLGYTTDPRMRGLQAKSYAALGKKLQQHRAQGEVYVLQGQLLAAIEQLQLAQKSPDGDFFEYSQVDARLRELKAQHAEELARKKQQER